LSYPYDEIVVDPCTVRRIFDRYIPNEELIWHRDREDRTVRVVEAEGWYLQMDDSLPLRLVPGRVYEIPRESWHRIIRKNNCGNLVVEIMKKISQ
jgi:quercetin dioxygenase-like cupin family protein